MNQTKVTIIIPVYNVAPFIEKCVQSVMRQTYEGALECLLIDDCGTDESVAITERLIAEYVGPILFKVIHHEKNRGLSCARNTGIDAATGDCVYFLDSDDYITDDCIECLVDSCDGFDVVFGNHFIGERKDGVLKRDSGALTGEQYVLNYLQGRQLPTCVWNKLFKLDYLKKYNLYFVPGIIMEDSVFTFMYSCYPTKLFFVNRITYYYRVNRGGSIVDELRHDITILKDSIFRVWLMIQERCSSNFYNEIHELYLHVYGFMLFNNCRKKEESFYHEFRVMHRKYPYKPLWIWLREKQSFHWYKTRLCWSLPFLLGYGWLQAKLWKNELCKRKTAQ